MNEKWKSFLHQMFVIGTPECAVFFGAAAMVLALLFLALGFWKTVLVALLVCVGGFIGGVKDKKGWLKNLINRTFPPKNQIPYREKAEKVEQILKDTEDK